MARLTPLVVGFWIIAFCTPDMEATKRRAVRKPDSPVLRFSSSSVATAANRPELNLTSAMTLDLWIYQTGDHHGGQSTLLKRDNVTRPWTIVLRLLHQGGSERLMFQVHDSASENRGLFGSSPIPRRQWVHIACATDSVRLRCWVDGIDQGSTPIAGFPRLDSQTMPLQIGEGFGGFNGVIRDLRVWNRALPASEIRAIARNESLPSNGLVAHWPMRDGSGEVLTDLGPYGIAMALGSTQQHDGQEPSWIPMDRVEEGPYFETRYLPLAERYLNVAELLVHDLSGDGYTDVQVVGGPEGTATCTYPYHPPQVQPSVSFRATNGGTSFDLTSSLTEWEIFGLTWHRYVADFTGDGREDIFLAATGPEFAFHNLDCDPPGEGPEDSPGDQSRILIAHTGGFREETRARLPVRISYDYGTAITDVDGDHDLDIVLLRPINEATEHPTVQICLEASIPSGAPCPVVLMNNGQGFFTEDFTRLAPEVQRGRNTYWTAAAADIDRDGDPDLMMGYSTHPDYGDMMPSIHVLLNDGTGRFTLRTDLFPDQPRVDGPYPGPESMVPADFDRDGWLDVLEVIGTRGESRLYLNNRDGSFRDASQNLPEGLRDYGAYRCEGYDLNADGATDVLCMIRYTGPPYGIVLGRSPGLFYNRGDGTFEMMPDIDGLGYGQMTYAADVDRDGDLDLVGAVGGTFFVAYQKKPYVPQN
jgi:hypothetical protein